MNCPYCGELFDGMVCGSCLGSDRFRIPGWWRRCLSRNHDVSIETHSADEVEFFCDDCNEQAGKGERVKAQRGGR